MKSCVILSLCLLSGIASLRVPADVPKEDVAQPLTRVQQLEAENKALRAEVVQLKDELHKIPGGKADIARQGTYLRFLAYLDKALQEKPDDIRIRIEAADTAKSLAPEMPGQPLVWKVLVATKVLTEGMSLEEVRKLLGPPTEQSKDHIGWYFNPSHRHVAPYLYATITKEGLTGWKLDRR